MKAPNKTGRFLGLPYDFRRPTRARLRERSWNLQDRHLFTPQAVGIGYSLNWYELGRRLHLLR
jgi:hypothetical protein